MKIAIASDHIGMELKPLIIDYVKELGHDVQDFGPYDTVRTDYPIYGEKVAKEVAIGGFDKGILICGTGVGICIAANKVKGIRAIVCSEPYSATSSRAHNDTNILAFGSRVIGSEVAKLIVKSWLETEFEGGRHTGRIEMISEIEND